jgi:NADH:ubiquinone oxidoreductase subunit
MSITTALYTKIFGKQVGADRFGNRYYTGKRQDSFGRIKRWVSYAGKPDPSSIPPEWHLWLHYTSNEVPQKRYAWQQEHHPNLTGTTQAYFPPGHLLKGGKRDKATGDYVPWTPK